MGHELIHNRGRGPEIVGTRTTVYNLLPYFVDPAKTETDIARLYNLAVEQIAAARAYVLNNAETVLETHLKIEARIAAGNPPEVVEQAKRTHIRFTQFKEWLDNRKRVEQEAEERNSAECTEKPTAPPFPNFLDWLNMQHRIYVPR